MTLNEFAPGAMLEITKLTGSGAVKRRIMDMGLTRGTRLYIRKVAPLGDPLELTARGYELSLRKADAVMIEVRDAGSTQEAAA
ncbi:FeoA family protein [Faecalibaculum rodentium]|jgi:ferrous iron transport protein A|uniref:Ferrous iron transport protein A n=1 Tax=Faecalibaculum rodentium TaxID=1702221 RepID=A0A1Q9YI00_9FIRM|nr:ferrous iron transport protein A [Faecalibaculum rodentium]OLU43819.1 ferrous iron transport protein A [Faecalibaculum rodentium]